MQATYLTATTLEEHSTVMAALRRSIRYCHHHVLRNPQDNTNRQYWLGEARQAYALYRRAGYGAVSSLDRYHSLVEFITKARI